MVRTWLTRSATLVAVCLSLFAAAGTAHAAARTPVAPTSATIVSTSAPDQHGGVWVHTVRAWKTVTPLSLPDAHGNVYAEGTSTITPYSLIGGGCGSGYTTVDNGWHYAVGPVWFLQIDFWSQDEWNDCNATVTNKYVDPQCVAYQGSECKDTSQGVNPNISCVFSGVFGVCDRDWANVNTYNRWTAGNRIQYMRTEVDEFGNYAFNNNVG